jgi:hypothetical protein
LALGTSGPERGTYTRPEVVYVPVLDAPPGQVFLAFVAQRESRLLEDFLAAATPSVTSTVRGAMPGGTAGW